MKKSFRAGMTLATFCCWRWRRQRCGWPTMPAKFDPATYTTVSVTLDGVSTKLRQYRIVYVANPIKMATTQAVSGAAVR